MAEQTDNVEVVEELKRLRAEVRRLKSEGVPMMIDANGWLRVYGSDGQYSVTRPADQWIWFLDREVEIRDFIKANEATFAMPTAA